MSVPCAGGAAQFLGAGHQADSRGIRTVAKFSGCGSSAQADPQGMGSAMTYASRYALTAMLGMVTEDDDAESARTGRKLNTRLKLPVSGLEAQKRSSRDPSNNSLTTSNRPPAALENLPPLKASPTSR